MLLVSLALLSAASAAAVKPFSLTICRALPGRIAHPRCPDGFTLTAAAPAGALRQLGEIAPSQYQANWRRSGGTVHGGPIVDLIMNEVMRDVPQQLLRRLDGFHVGPARVRNAYLPPVPFDFVSALAVHAGQFHLPEFAYPLSTRPLTSFNVSVWQITHAPWKASAVLPQKAVLTPFIKYLDAEAQDAFNRQELDGMRLTGELGGSRRWEPVRSISPGANPRPLVVDLHQGVSRHDGGLTFNLNTTIVFRDPLRLAALARDRTCELALDRLLPRQIFIDADEANHHLKVRGLRNKMSYVFAQFHDIELPAHLATPVIFRTKLRLDADQTTYSDDMLPLHSRYQIDYSKNGYSEVQLSSPIPSVICEQTRVQVEYHSVQSDSPALGRPHALVVPSVTIPTWPLVYVAVATTIVLIVATAHSLHKLLPVILTVPYAQTKRESAGDAR